MFTVKSCIQVFNNCYEIKFASVRSQSLKLKKHFKCYNFATVYIKNSPVSARNYQKILVNDNAYSDNVLDRIKNKEWGEETPQILFETLANLKNCCRENNISISDPKFDYFIDYLTDNIQYASERELKTIFSSLTMLKENVKKSSRIRNYIEVWTALDDECCNRRSTMTIEDKLTYISLFNELGAIKYSKFCYTCCSRVLRHMKYLSKAQVLSITTHIGMMKQLKKDENIHNIEVYIQENFNNFEIDELAIMSMALCKIDVCIRNPKLVKTIINEIIKNSRNIQEHSLLKLIKIIIISVNYTNYDMVYRLCEHLFYQLSRLSYSCHVYIALLGASANTIHEPCLTYVADNVLKLISTINLINIDKIIFAYGHLNYIPQTKECFFTKIVEELRKDARTEEINRNSRNFVRCLVNLGLLNVYPQDLLKKVLSKEFLGNVYGKSCLTYDIKLLGLHNAAKVFYREFNISELVDKEVLLLSKKNELIHNQNKKLDEENILDIKELLQSLCGGSEYVIVRHILRYYEYKDYIICKNYQGIPQPVREAFEEQQHNAIQYPPDTNTWIVLIISDIQIKKQISDTENFRRPSGDIIAKKRMLDKLGYHSVIISMEVYVECSNYNEKIKYLKTLVNDALKIIPNHNL